MARARNMLTTPNTEHLVLLFAYHYPPENTVGAARPFRFAKYLARLGYTCRVFTAAEQAGRCDPVTVYVPDPFFTREHSRLEWQVERAIRKLILPGELGTQWSYHACRAARACLRAHPGAQATVFSTFPPLGPHLAAWQLVRSERLPWIADFRDPFPDGSERKKTHPLQQQVYRRLDRTIARRTNVVIANTDGALAQWREKFPALNGKVQLIWNGFDPEERIFPLPLPKRNYKVLSHVGNLYHRRTAGPILESIARLLAAGRLPQGSVHVRLIGAADAEALPNAEFLGGARQEGWLDLVTERLPHREALDIARSSDGLLLLQPQSSTQVPGKLFEYLQIGRPVLALVPPGSPSERLLERSGVRYRCVDPQSSLEAIDSAVARFFELPQEPEAPNAWFEEQFNVGSQTLALHHLILSLHGEGEPAPPVAATWTTRRAPQEIARE